MGIEAQLWDAPHWSKYEYMSDLYQNHWMDITFDKQTIQVWI